MKIQEKYPVTKACPKRDMKTTLHPLHDRVVCKSYRVVFLPFFTTIFCSRVVFLHFYPCLFSVLCKGPFLHVINFYRKHFGPSICINIHGQRSYIEVFRVQSSVQYCCSILQQVAIPCLAHIQNRDPKSPFQGQGQVTISLFDVVIQQ